MLEQIKLKEETISRKQSDLKQQKLEMLNERQTIEQMALAEQERIKEQKRMLMAK